MRSALLLIMLFAGSLVSAQIVEPKFGKIDPSELSMTSYDKDTTADALVLFDAGYTKFVLSPREDFQFEFTRHLRIKIFKKSAFRFADFSFRLYESGLAKEKLSDLKAVTYNLIDGKVVKTKLDNDAIFEEKASSYSTQKFAFPQVKEGSVIELTYSIVSDFLYELRGWTFQYSVPAVWSKYVCEIPEYFNYRQSSKGFLPYDISTNEMFEAKFNIMQRGQVMETGGIHSSSQNVSIPVNTFRQVYAVKNVPAFKSEPNIDCEDNYIQSIEFELSSTKFPDSPIKEYSRSWESVNDQMNDDDDFGKVIRSDNFISDTVQAICKGKTDQLEKATAIYSWVQNNMKWNGSYRIWARKGLKKPLAEHSGTSAEINLLLTVMLQSAGLTANPVMFSTRDNGIALSIIPTITKFNSVLTRLVIDGKPYMLDATNAYCPFGYLPPNDINGQGRVVNKTGGDWANLETKLKYLETKNYVLKILPEGSLQGYIKELRDGYAAMNFRTSLSLEKSNDDYFRKIQEGEKGLTINAFSVSDIKNIYKPAGDSMAVEITERVQNIGDKLLIQPLLLETIDKNRYTLEERKYPVNYNYPITETYIFEYEIPEGYVVESMPQPAVMKLPDNSLAVYYDVKNNGNKIMLVYKRTINKLQFEAAEYKQLKDLYDKIVKKHAENIILKKSA
jgi:hypothetical protein